MHKSTFGIDIGHHLVKLVELRYEPALRQTAALASFIEVPKDKTTGPVGLVRTLKHLFPRRLRRTAEAALGIYGGSNLLLKRIDLKGLSREDLVFAAAAESEQYLPENGEGYLRGFTTTNPVVDLTPECSEVAFVGIRQPMCDFYDEVLMCSHKNPVAFEAAGLALAATYQRASLRSEDRLVGILDVGEHSTKIILLKEGRFFHYNEIDVGCRSLVSALQRKLGVALWPAILLLSGKKAAGLDPEYAAQHVQQEAADFVDRVRDAVWQARQAAQTWYFDRALICGGGASIAQLIGPLSSLFRYGMAILDPFRGLIFQVKKVSKTDIVPTSAMFAVAMGLALRTRYTRAQTRENSFVLPGHRRLLGH